MVEKKSITTSENSNFLIECDKDVDFDSLLSEIKVLLIEGKDNYFSQEYFFFNSIGLDSSSFSELSEVEYTSQFFTIFFHNEKEFIRLMSLIDFHYFNSLHIYFIFVIPSFDLSNFKENEVYDLFSHLFLKYIPSDTEIVDPLFENKPINKLSGFDLFEKSGFSSLSDHFKVEYILSNKYSKETIKKLSFFGIISLDICDFLLKKKSEEETIFDKINHYSHAVRTYFLTIF